MVGKSVFILPFGSFEGTLSTFNPWHGRCVALEDAAGLFTHNQYR